MLHSFIYVGSSEPLQSIQTGLPAYINDFKRATRKQKLSICLFSMVMFFQEADQNRYQRSDSIAAVLILRLPLASMIAVPQQPQVVAGSDHCPLVSHAYFNGFSTFFRYVHCNARLPDPPFIYPSPIFPLQFVLTACINSRALFCQQFQTFSSDNGLTVYKPIFSQF